MTLQLHMLYFVPSGIRCHVNVESIPFILNSNRLALDLTLLKTKRLNVMAATVSFPIAMTRYYHGFSSGDDTVLVL